MTTTCLLHRLARSRRALIALFCSIAFVPLGGSGHDRPRGYRDAVWVVNRDQGTVMVFDVETGQPVTPVPLVVAPGVHDIVVSSRTGKAFVTDDATRVLVLSTATHEVVDTIPFAPGNRPHHLSLSEDGKTVYVGLFGTNRFAAIDTRTHAVVEIASSEEPGPLAHAPEPSADRRFVLVPHEIGNLVTEVSVREGTVRRQVRPGDTAAGQPSEVLSTRDGETIYVSMRNEGKVKTIDGETFLVTGGVTVGTQPESLILTPDERILIVSLRGSPARLAFVRTDTLTLLGTVDIGGTGTFGDLAVSSPDGRYVYATFDGGAGGQGGVARVRLDKGTVETWSYPGVGRPHGIAYEAPRHRR